MDGQRVSLGCGTLVLIAVIVLVFSNSDRGDRANMAPVLQKLEKIEGQLEKFESQLEDIERDLARLRAAQ